MRVSELMEAQGLADDEVAVGFFLQEPSSSAPTVRSSSAKVLKKSDVAKLEAELGKSEGGPGWYIPSSGAFKSNTKGTARVDEFDAHAKEWMSKARKLVNSLAVRNLPVRLKFDAKHGQNAGGQGVDPSQMVTITY